MEMMLCLHSQGQGLSIVPNCWLEVGLQQLIFPGEASNKQIELHGREP